jgi:predicted enzyme related to lactoylglutathione lyase
MSEHHKINYVEFPATNLDATKQFFEQVFNWQFTDYGPEYTSFANSGINGGFFQANLSSSTENGGALSVIYSNNLEETLAHVEQAGGEIVKPIFSFPGGRRFHFKEPSGNEFAAWSYLDNE